MGFAKECLDQAAKDKMMKRIDEAGAGNYDTPRFKLRKGLVQDEGNGVHREQARRQVRRRAHEGPVRRAAEEVTGHCRP